MKTNNYLTDLKKQQKLLAEYLTIIGIEASEAELLNVLIQKLYAGGIMLVDQTYVPTSENAQSGKAVAEAVSDKQDSLVSGTNIKTINNQSILGSGNITIEGGSDVEVDQNYNPESENAQSGKAVKEAINTAAAIIPGEGSNSIKQNCPFNWASGKASVSIGSNVKTYGDSSIGIGRDLNVRNAYDGNINIDGSNGVNIGYMSTLYNQDGVSLGRENKNYSYVGITAGFNNIAGRPEYADKQFGDDKARGAIAAGWENHAIHAYACVLGDHNNSSRNSQTVFGSYCADDPDALFILGNGTSADNRSNSCTIDKDGNACFTGNVYVGSSKKDGGKRLATIEEGTWPITLFNVPFVGETSVIQPTYTIEYTYCHYFAIDNLVYVNCDTKFIVTNAGRGYACIGGLPFISQNKVSFSVGEVYGCIEGGDGIGYTDGNESRRIRMESNTSQAAIYTGSGASALSFKSGYDSGGKYENCLWIKFSGTYIRG